jgi:hypothetical protein
MLTDADRAHLRGEKEYNHESNRLAADARIRSRVLEGLHDGSPLWTYLNSGQREKIFSKWQTQGERVHEDSWWEGWDQDAERAREYLETSLTGLLALIFRGIDEGDVMSRERLIKQAIATAEHEQGQEVTDITLDVETGFETDELLRRFKNRDPSLSMREINHLRREGLIDRDDTEAYEKEIFGKGADSRVDPSEIEDADSPESLFGQKAKEDEEEDSEP